MLDYKTPRKQVRRGLVILAAVFSLTLTTLTVSAQTEPGPADPAPDEAEIDYPADTRVCSGEGWTDVDNDSDLARACLAAVGVNSGTAVYAFARPVDGYDPDNPMGGGPEEAGLVSRWAMAEALYRSIDAAVENPMPEPSAAARSYFTDVGWLSEGTRNKIAVLYDLEVTAGTSQEGIYDPAGTVTRGQMSLFFVRTMRAVEQLYQLPEFGPPDGAYDEKFTDIWEQRISEIRSAITAGRWDCTAASFPAREQLGVPFVDVCGWENDSERVPAVWLIYDLGVTVGFPADDANRRYYRAAEPVTGGQMAKFLVRLLAHTELPGWHPRQQPPEPPETPVVIDGKRSPDGSWHPGYGILVDPDPFTRPPREIDFYYYAGNLHPDYREIWEQVGIYHGQVLQAASRPLSLQVGDWWWNTPSGDDDRSLNVLLALRTGGAYIAASSDGINLNRDPYPILRLIFCSIPDDSPDDSIYTINVGWRVAPGVFRLARESVQTDTIPEGTCDPSDYGVPEPAGGYTENFPCAGTTEYVTRLFGESLTPCRT